MYVDKQIEFSDAQAITATAISTNVYDLFSTDSGGSTEISPNTTIDIGAGEDLFLVISVPVSLTGGTSIVFSLESDSTANLATAPVVHYASGAVLTAALVAGSVPVKIKLPYGSYKRYLGVRYTVVGPYAAGSVDAFITVGSVDANRPYKSGFTVQ